MYCYHCGKKINESKARKNIPNFIDASNAKDASEVNMSLVCPRCGHLISEHAGEEETKQLAQASHSLVQKANNSFAKGMGSVVLGLILLVTGLIFFLLARKASNGHQLSTNCAEFYVFIVLTSISVILLLIGAVKVVYGVRTKKHYTLLLKDLNNKVFKQ